MIAQFRLSVVGLVIVAWVGWRYGDAIFPQIEERLGMERDVIVVEEVQASEALSETANEGLVALVDGDLDELALTGAELTSLLRYTHADVVPEGIANPTVRLENGRAFASADVAPADFPSLPDLGPIAGMLPDVVRLELSGSVMGFGEGDAALVVQGIDIGGIPLPRTLIPEILNALGRTDQAGLPREAVAVDLPDGVESAHVADDRLVLVADG